MKFTKLMALALVLVMLVSSFVACGGGKDTETDAPDTQAPATETDPPATETDPPATETDPPATETEECKHPRTKDGDSLPATCTTDGYTTKTCLICKEEVERVVIPAAHTETGITSLDGNYQKLTCTVCGNVRIADKDGKTVTDTTGIMFHFFSTGFEGKKDIVEALTGYADVKLGENQYTQVVFDPADNNSYVNVPSGTVDDAPNGCFVVEDVNNKLPASDFSLSLKVQFIEMPTATLPLVTWTVGETSYALVSITTQGRMQVLGTSTTYPLADKGWDEIKVEVDIDTGVYYVYLNGVAAMKGNMGAAVTGKTGSSVKFFDLVGQFEANIDDISLQDGITLTVPTFAPLAVAPTYTATILAKEDFQTVTGVTDDILNAEGSAFAKGGLKVQNNMAKACELVTDEKGNTYMKKNTGAYGFYIFNTEDKIFNDALLELSFDFMGLEGSQNCSLIGFKVGGDPAKATDGTEYRALCNFAWSILVGADGPAPRLIKIDTANPTWHNYKVLLDTATYDFKVWIDGEFVAETDLANGKITYLSEAGFWTTLTSLKGVTRLPTTADKEADFRSFYLFHNNKDMVWALDNLSIGIVK